MNKSLLAASLFFTVAMLPTTCFADVTPLDVNPYQHILEHSVKADEPGAAVIVSKNGQVIYKDARGLANIEHQVPITTTSVFRLASITKQFTGAAIMMLQEQNKLSVNDNIHKYVPGFPTDGHVVTIEHLLTHTSGLANYTNDNDLLFKETKIRTSLDDMIERFKQHPMEFKPGDKMSYSNTGYVLLGKVIEVASGKSYQDFIEQDIFAKLGMKNSYFDSPKVIKNRVNGYIQTDQGIANAPYIDMMWPHAAGSLLSTVEDLNIWFTALQKGTLISNTSYSKMIKPFTLNNGSISNYGYGLANIKINKYNAIAHSGGIFGFATNAFYIPEKKVYIAALSNSREQNPNLITQKLAAQALDIPLPKFNPITLNIEKVRPLLGDYKINNDSTRTLLIENDKLYSQRDGGQKFELTPMSHNSFYYENSLSYIVIEKNPLGQYTMNFYSDLALEPQQATKL